MTAQKRTGATPDWDLLRTLLALARCGTLSAAARALGVDHTTVARRLEALERDMGRPLFERSPAGYAPTPAGEEALAAAERMQSEVDGLMRRVDGAALDLSGQVRLTSTPHLAGALLVPALGDLLRRHPSLQVELIGDSRALDLSRREADVALRLARPEKPGLVARRIGRIAFALYAGAADRRAFAEQRFLAYEEPSGAATIQRYLADMVADARIVLRSNTMQVLIEAARAGLGAAVLPCFVGEADPALARVRAPRPAPLLPLWVVYHEDLRRSPRVKALVGFLDEVIQAERKRLVPPDFPFDPP